MFSKIVPFLHTSVGNYGLIAEEVAKVYPDLVVHGKDRQVETVQYHKLVPMLLNEIQHLHDDVEKLKAKSGLTAGN